MPELVSTNVEELRASVREALGCRDQAMAYVERSLAAVVKAGRLLNQAKGELPHGQFMQWVENEVQDISYPTANRWMKLATYLDQSGADLDNAAKLRQAYILAGLLPESESGGSAGSGSALDAYLTHVVRATTHLSARLAKKPIEEWPLEDRRILRARIEPLVKIYEQLVAI